MDLLEVKNISKTYGSGETAVKALKASITALMSSFGRAFHAENEEHPVFADHLAKNLMTEEEYVAVQGYILGGAQFFEPEIDSAAFQPKELLRRLVNVHIAPSPLCRAAYTEKSLKAAALTGAKQYVISMVKE